MSTDISEFLSGLTDEQLAEYLPYCDQMIATDEWTVLWIDRKRQTEAEIERRKPAPPPTYPEHEKLRAINDESQAQGAFVEWLVQHGYADLFGDLIELLAEYHHIDRNRLEAEKRQMLAELAAAQELPD